MEIEEQQINRIARKAGMWAALTFIGTIFTISVLIFIVRFAWEAAEQSRASAAAIAMSAAEEKVSPEFRRDAELYVKAWSNEHESAAKGKAAFDKAKSATQEAFNALQGDTKTTHELRINQDMTSSNFLYETCVDSTFGPYAYGKLKDCTQRSVDDVRTASTH